MNSELTGSGKRGVVRPGHRWRLRGEDDESSLADEVYHAILLRIIRSELPGGTELKSTQLARELEVSRTPVAQALARLAADGIVTQQRNQRAVVRPGAENWLVEIHEMRVLLEPSAARWATGRIPQEAIAELRGLARAAQPVSDGGEPLAARRFDYALHLAIAEHCGNLPVGEAIRKCWSYKRLSYVAGDDSPESLEQGYRDHLAILEALEAGDGATAEAAMLFHLRTASRQRSDSRIV